MYVFTPIHSNQLNTSLVTCDCIHIYYDKHNRFCHEEKKGYYWENNYVALNGPKMDEITLLYEVSNHMNIP